MYKMNIFPLTIEENMAIFFVNDEKPLSHPASGADVKYYSRRTAKYNPQVNDYCFIVKKKSS